MPHSPPKAIYDMVPRGAMRKLEARHLALRQAVINAAARLDVEAHRGDPTRSTTLRAIVSQLADALEADQERGSRDIPPTSEGS